METAFVRYKRTVSQLSPLADANVPELASRTRQGDDAALRQLAGGCLSMCLGLVETTYPDADDTRKLELAEEANAAMVRALPSFRGAHVGELLQFVERAVVDHLHGISED